MNEPTFHDVIVIGAGVCGIYQLKRLRDAGFDAVVLEGSEDLGGTWFNNRYPGARFDSESYTYGYSFSPELLEEWHWKERFSGQPENLRYLRHVAERFGLREHMRFGQAVTGLVHDDAAGTWTLTTGEGHRWRCRVVITALGLLSSPTLPRIDGMADFAGPSFHTYHWPHEGLELAGKRVGVIGTGATGIQVIGEIADKVGSLHVFQRRPNWNAPLNNAAISESEMAAIRARYDAIFENCARSPGGFEHVPDRRGFFEVDRAEREALWARLYDEPGFGIWLANFREIFTDESANAEFSAWVADRMRERVTDPAVAEKLIPRDHGFGVQRLPLETRYLEAYNRENVTLVDIAETPIERITSTGIETTAAAFDLDIIVYATGFDAITGAWDRMDIRGLGGQSLRDKWRDGLATWYGLMNHGFPNLFMPAGPQSGSASTNFPRGIEVGVDWVTDLLVHMRERGVVGVEADLAAEQAWTDHVREMYSIMLMRKAKGWFTGYNSNVPGHEEGTIRYFVYNGGAPKYLKRITGEADAGYPGLRFHAAAKPSDTAA